MATPIGHETGEAWSLDLLVADRTGRRLPLDRRLAALQRALATGCAAAQRLRAAHGTADPFSLARHLGVAVTWSAEAPALGAIVLIAEYAPRPPAIRLFAESVDRISAAEPSLPVAGVYVAHELYHHLEAAGLGPASELARVTLARVGPWRWESEVRALSEVAAHSFAQALLDLPFFPGVLDRLALGGARPLAAGGPQSAPSAP